jgi:hypothetical protein
VLGWPRWQARMIQLKAERYLNHNRTSGPRSGGLRGPGQRAGSARA